ncbi:MAG: PorV/PorQ family protein [Bacteroidota bacterium]|nr:PorV/PorQ family protein [Bacteroidota bacterium]
MKNLIRVFIILKIGSAFLFSQNIQTGLTFLKLGIGARSSGMGEAFTSIPNDHSSFTYNPASIRSSYKSQLILSHRNGFAETTTEYFGATIPGEDITIGFSALTTSVNGIEVRLQPGEAEKTFDAKNGMLGIGAAINISENISIGLTGKLLYEKIFVDEASGYAFDGGILYKYDTNLNFGFSATNFGHMGVLRSKHSIVPATVRAGASYNASIFSEIGLLTSGDFVKTIDDDGMHVHVGAEAMYNSLFALRLGYQTGYETKNISGGIGILYNIIRFDYAFVPNNGAFTPNHVFSLNFYL